ncbi:carbon-nitrogen hydrolase family protein [Pseudemcibacter aquimaris]|uniref:carbon-nitrogen hydrolase family protein n=1 Tax=Pseudemcibacter aquimaris TaxID=2857064 RepID=UPI0020117B85|nr:carbon-nitrogen hydrolase family protein [Pseudemcibacter aquimaris]MCC3861803.1 carbon-nitrogen hydrolase family protein [Pseudemcibacter aquimaris]WDU58558.1 carbon-nitrogen hydrolase family protein [Pseudemcibacter aquimaris]
MSEVSRKLKIGIVQMTSNEVIEENVRLAEKLIRDAAAKGADFILTPEMTTLLDFGTKQVMEKVVPEDQDDSWPRFAALAKELGVWLMIGSIAIRNGDKAANRCFVFSPDGKKQATYDKIHMFDVDIPGDKAYRESNAYQAGEEAVLVKAPWCKVGLSICYDLRFPHLYRSLAQAGAEILTVPSAFTYVTGKAHWHTLLKARAIENGAFVIAPAQVGDHRNGRKTYGHSLVVSPWGEVLADLKGEQGTEVIEIDLEEVSSARKRIASLTHDKKIVIKG